MIEPPPFACAQEDDEHEALTAASSSDSASHSHILKSPLHEDAQQHDPSHAHRVRFINDAEEGRSITSSYAPSPLPFAISPVETTTASDKNPADENDDNYSDAHQQLDLSENVRNSTSSSSYYTTSSMNTKTSTQNHDDGNGHASDAVADSSDGPGITILDESSIYRSSSRSIANSAAEPISSAATSQLRRPASSSFFQTQIIDDSIIRSAAAHADANLQYSNVVPSVNQNANGDASSILNQLMQYANDDEDDEGVQTGDYKPRSQRITEEQLSIDDNSHEDDDNETNIFSTVSDDRRRRLWELPKHFLSLLQQRKRKDVSNNSNNVPTAALANPSRSPIRSHRIRHDKYIVEVDIMPTQSSLQSSVNIRDAIDILANIDLLHLWFEPIPSVFDACAKDGSGREVSPQTSPANSISSSAEGNNNDINSGNNNNNNNNIRQYDGEWIEISSSLLALPSDARISRCFSATRVNLRKMIGFPARVRSMMFVERSAGRVGLTLGPFPDRLFHGTMAHHTFHVSVVNVDEDEEIGLGMGLGGMGSRQKIVISDEVRLQREGDDEGGFMNGGRKRNGYCYCALFRVLFSIIEWITVLWYQPDFASYMSQTISSMEKLRVLIECGGETGAYASGELVMEAEDWEEGGRGNTSIRSPLLG